MEEFEDFESISRKDKRQDRDRAIPGVTEIVKAVLIGGITAAVIHLFSLPRLEEKIDNQAHALTELRQEYAELRRDLYVPRSGHLSSLDQLEPFASVPNDSP